MLARMRELQAEPEAIDDLAESMLSEFVQRAIIKMCLNPSTQKFVEPAMELLEPEMFDSIVAKACFNEVKAFWTEHGSLLSVGTANHLLDVLKRSVSVDDADFSKFYALFKEELDPSEVKVVRTDLDKWVKSCLWKRVVGSEEAIDALARGDYDVIRRLVAEAEGGGIVEKEEVLDFFAAPEKFLAADSVRRLKLSQPTLTEALGSGGPAKGEVLTYLGRTGGGKSIALANDAVGSALARQNTLFVTFEISKIRMAQRCASILTGIDTDQLINHPESVAKQCRNQITQLGSSTLRIVHLSPGRWSVNKVRQIIKKLGIDEGWVPEVVILDYMELMTPRGKSARQQSEYERQKEVANDLSYLASEENVFVVSATQANREGLKNEANVKMEHMAESFGKAMNMDYIVSLNQTREERDALSPLLRLVILKNREGECRTIHTTINYRTKRIREANNE
jgi:KaiC/GvpD/RAD55 family RecA-like ATPase